MDEFAKLPSDERRLYFEQAAATIGRSIQIVEKDFWVCWCLRRLFSLNEFRDHLTFKGGTSLSKVYQAIDRFSEDVDVSIERGFLGFGGAEEPERGPSGKEQQRRIARLKEACQTTIANRLMPQLDEAFTKFLEESDSWTLSLDPADPDQQTLLFQYPSATPSAPSAYLAPRVKIELGARSDHFPVVDAKVKPYLAEALPDAIPDEQTQIRVLAATRTFWEKATILHMIHYWPEGKKLAPRMSRHYYDVFRLSQGPVLAQALAAVDLLNRVADHKQVYFKASWAKYDLARPGSLRLIPDKQLITFLLRDYADMRPMFFTDPPQFEQILERLAAIEKQINEG